MVAFRIKIKYFYSMDSVKNVAVNGLLIERKTHVLCVEENIRSQNRNC